MTRAGSFNGESLVPAAERGHDIWTILGGRRRDPFMVYAYDPDDPKHRNPIGEWDRKKYSVIVDDAGEKCFTGEVQEIALVTRLPGPNPLEDVGHSQIRIGDDEYIGFGPAPHEGALRAISIVPGTTDGYGHPDPGSRDILKFRGCPQTVRKLREAAKKHKNDDYQACFTVGENCLTWAYKILWKSGLPVEPI